MALPPAGIYCPCEGRVFPPDHYSSGACTHLPMPIAAIRSIMLSEADDDFHAAGRITVTRLLTCPREILISDNIPLVVDVRRLDSRRKGTVLHEDLRHHVATGYAEIEFPRPGEPPPTILGEPVSGRVDFVASDFSRIEDYKTHAESSLSTYLRPKRQPGNSAAQLNILRILIARGVLRIEPDEYRPRLSTWHTAQTAAGIPPWGEVEEPYMTESEIGAFKPGGGDYTVNEILDAYRQFRIDRQNGMTMDDALRNVPLAGRRMFRSQKCYRYCGALAKCNELAGIPNSDWSGQ